MIRSRFLVVLLALAAGSAAPVAAQDQGGGGDGGSSAVARTVLQAIHVDDGDIVIDGVLDEAVWSQAAVATDFVQREPDDGEPATERTEARVLYGANALYVAFRAYDSEPSEIVGQLARRDQQVYSDWLFVAIDSYFDRRTAFRFGVNPAGVRVDTYHFDDTNEDDSWDAVWDAQARVDGQGWTAEFEIPYSQLRFAAGSDTWGIQFARSIARRDETSLWAPVSQQDGALVSRFGELRGLRALGASRRLEVLPYSVARLTRGPGDVNNPFYSKNDMFGSVGADVKYGITNDLTLDLTINPDFGQVEADPGQVNLSAFETFFQERRPFFVEGAGIFNFRLSQGDGDDANESLFYSRRIGRAPQGFADPQGGYTQQDAQTSILGAWKLSGKTASGWSVGLMHGVTQEEHADIMTGAGLSDRQIVEPLTNYAVARIIRDFRGGKSAIGFVSTAANRTNDIADELGLRSGGYTGGFDFRHRFWNDRWAINGFVIGSHVRGSADAILATQRSSARYFQRPDAGHVHVDPTRTSLTGWSSNFSFTKFAGGFWRVGTGFSARSPEFESNDLGFMTRADFVSPWVWLGYHKSTAGEHLRQWNLNVNSWTNWNFDGQRTALGANINGFMQLNNFWGGYAGVMRQAEGWATTALRGGPMLRQEGQWRGWGGMFSDSRKAVGFNLNSWWGVRPESDSWDVGFSPNVNFRAGGRFRASVGPSINKRIDDRQWVQARTVNDETRYILGRIDQTTVGLTTRLDYSFTPDLSLQLYAQPFTSAGEYSDFKTVVDPAADSYDARFRGITAQLEDPSNPAAGYVGDLNGDGAVEAFRNPDFNLKQFRSNIVLRWEYRPGSQVFLVWSQGRDTFRQGDGSFDFGRDFEGVFADTQPENVFLIKFSYWLSP